MASDHCQIELPACDTRLQKYHEMQLLSAAYIRNLAVIGGGQMGTGIAQVAAIAGQQVLVLIQIAGQQVLKLIRGEIVSSFKRASTNAGGDI